MALCARMWSHHMVHMNEQSLNCSMVLALWYWAAACSTQTIAFRVGGPADFIPLIFSYSKLHQYTSPSKAQL